MCRVMKNWVTWHTCSQLRLNKWHCLLISAPILYTNVSLIPHFVHFCALGCWFHCLKGPPSIMLSVIHKAVMCLMEKMCMLDKLDSGICCRAIGHGFNVTESTIYSKQGVLKWKHIKQGWSVDRNIVNWGLQDPNSESPLGAMVQYLLIQCLQWFYRT